MRVSINRAEAPDTQILTAMTIYSRCTLINESFQDKMIIEEVSKLLEFTTCVKQAISEVALKANGVKSTHQMLESACKDSGKHENHR
jgi:Fe2+ or Zn2+ uptake regulation protein